MVYSVTYLQHKQTITEARDSWWRIVKWRVPLLLTKRVVLSTSLALLLSCG